MSFVRTVLGDVATEGLGIVYAHEHVVIKGPFVEERFPEFLLADLDAIAEELKALRRAGVGAMIDAMPLDAGRSAADLIEVSKRTGIAIVASTGIHLRLYYPAEHWVDTIEEDALAETFVREIEGGMEATGARAGVIKVAGSLDRLTSLERRNFHAAARAQRRTGCPILTHTERGTAALEQARILGDNGADLAHVVLSHLDRNEDLAYHREVLSTGVRLEFDSAFRWGDRENGTQRLILALAPEFPDAIMIGMDAARPAYWQNYGGAPGLAYLLDTFVPALREAGLSEDLLRRILVHNPAQAYAFSAPRP